MNKTVAVAISGGIDSAVASLLLKQQGYNVIGLTGKMTCDSESIIENAKSVAEKLNIPHYVFDLTQIFKEKVITYFETSYKNGQTPNPCIMCNKFIKWGTLFDYAINELNADYIATGHYANIKYADNCYKLYPAKDEKKDQLYFLFMLEQKYLVKTLFPLYRYTKDEIRQIAQEYDLPPKSSKESQDICFIKPPLTTKKYLNNIFQAQKGEFVLVSDGKVIGHHEGYWQYTIGQRKGIGIAYSEPLYVTKIDSKNNIVYLGTDKDLLINSLVLKNINWSYPLEINNKNVLVKIRYNMQPVFATIHKKDNSWQLDFEKPVSNPAKGQACVLYDINDGHLLGGSFI